MKKRRTLPPLVSVFLFFALGLTLSLAWHASRPQTEFGEKHIVVEVIHSRGSTAEFTYDTDEEYLGDLLRAKGLISGTEGAYGLFVDTVDRETADYNVDGSWWKLSCNGEDSQVGVDEVVIHDGDLYTWAYTTG